MAAPGSGDGSNELRLKPRDSPIIVGRFTSCLSLPSLRLHPSGAGDDRDGCWRLLMLLDCSSTVEWGTTRAYRATKKYELITGAPGLDEVIEVLQRVDTVALDLETTGLSPVEDRVRLLSLHAGERTYLLDCFAL